MDFSAANTSLWNPIIQGGMIAVLLLVANVLRRKVPLIRSSLMPTAVLAGFLLLMLRWAGLLHIDTVFLEKLTYHALALGFIALSLRIPAKESKSSALIGGKSGALIVSTYLVQAVVGLVLSLGLAYTFFPSLFKASGILLPMAYGQGPGQANNVGTTYEALGMAGGRSFGLSLAAAGYLCACVVGVICLNIFAKQGKIKKCKTEEGVSDSASVDTFQDNNEIPISESVDKLTVQVALVVVVYLVTFLLTWGITELLQMLAPGLAATVGTLLWGFNFIIGSLIAMGCRGLFKSLKWAKFMNRQYQNNYLLSRISGLAFDMMIVAGIASINIEDLKGYWIPFLLMAVLGAAVTLIYLLWICKKLYPDYAYEGFFSMYGMLTGTISSGVLLLREFDPEFRTPAANNLISGSSFGIALGLPVLLLVSLAAKNDLMTWVSLGLVLIYLAALLLFLLKAGNEESKKGSDKR